MPRVTDLIDEADDRARLQDSATSQLRAAIDARLAAEETVDVAAADREIDRLLADADVLRGLAYCHAIDTAEVDPLLQRLRGLPGRKTDADKFGAAIRRRARQDHEQERRAAREGTEAPTPVDPRLRLDLPSEASCPGGYMLDSGGVYSVGEDADGNVTQRRITHAPVAITGRLIDEATGHQLCAVEWAHRGGRARRAIVPRVDLMTRRGIVGMAADDAPVHDRNAGDVIPFLAAWEATNRHCLPTGVSVSRMGPLDDYRAFVVGFDALTTDGESVNPDAPPSEWGEGYVRLDLPPGDGRHQIAAAYSSAGDLASWASAVTDVAGFPAVALALLAAFVPPLLAAIPEIPNAVVDWSGLSSHGKTTTLMVAASVWADPDPRAGGMIRPWAQTANAIEQAARVSYCLPTILDDTSTAVRREDVGRVVYVTVNGRGKGRATPDGMRADAELRTWLLSTGEAPAVSFTQDVGTRPRCLSVRGMPFGDGNKHAIVSELHLALLDNHGHAGRAYVRHLLERRDDRKAWRTRYRTLRAARAEAAKGNAFRARFAAVLAALDLAAELARAAGVLPLTETQVDAAMALAVRAAEYGADDADRPLAALREALAWAAMHPDRLYGSSAARNTPAAGWIGARQAASGLSLVPSPLAAHLANLGYDAEACFSHWRDRRWLKLRPSGSRRTVSVRIGGAQVECLAFSDEGEAAGAAE